MSNNGSCSIIKHGYYHGKILRFECRCCKAIFDATVGYYRVELRYDERIIRATCPECGSDNTMITDPHTTDSHINDGPIKTSNPTMNGHRWK